MCTEMRMIVIEVLIGNVLLRGEESSVLFNASAPPLLNTEKEYDRC